MIYLGYDVLEIEPNRREAENLSVNRSMELLDSATGAITAEAFAPTPVLVRDFSWFVAGLDEISAFLTWLDARKGRTNPFWVPTWHADLTVLSTSGANLLIEEIGYAEMLFPFRARQHIAIIAPAGITVHTVNSAAAVAGTETLGLSSGATVPQGEYLASFLLFCRLEDDESVVRWHTPSLLECELSMVELPREVP